MNLWGFGSGSADRRRRRLLRKATDGPLRDYLDVEFPDGDLPDEEIPLLAVDLETTGLDPRTDQLLSIGFVPVDGRAIRLDGARHLVLRQDLQGGSVGQSATIHGLTDDALAAGVTAEQALTELLAALRGRVLLAHHAEVERSFLSAACRTQFGAPAAFAIVDTLQLQARVLRVEPDQAPQGSLRLAAARQRYGLPRYRAHEALTDALACAELYLAQVAELGAGSSVSLRTLLS